MRVTKPLDLGLLEQELAAASVACPLGLGSHEVDASTTELYTFGATGLPVELPPDAVPVVDAHVAPPVVVSYAGFQALNAIRRTTDDLPLEIFRIPTQPQHVYRATFGMTGIDAVSGTTRDAEARMVFKRLAATLVQVGTTAVLFNAQDTAAASWAILPTVSGTDLVISVRGAAGRTIDWLLVGEIATYAPGGLTG